MAYRNRRSRRGNRRRFKKRGLRWPRVKRIIVIRRRGGSIL